jgi:hypothetical protein
MTRTPSIGPTRILFSLSVVLLSLGILAFHCAAQDLSPRAYLITPIHSNAIVVSYSFETGDILLNPTLPISNAKGTLHVPVFSYTHFFNFFGRSANITAGLPYAIGHFTAELNGMPRAVYRSGLYDTAFRFSVNLKGGPAMNVRQFQKWKQKTLVGVSVSVSAPTGQYDPTLLVNLGTNRWAIKPEIGVSRRWNHWVADFYGGVWLFTENSEFFSHNAEFPGVNTQSQNPLGALEGHLSYDVRPRFWVSVDGNYWYGGETYRNGVKALGTLESNSRVGLTASVPLQKHQSLKFSYSYGAVVRVGGNYNDLSVGWQYSWVGKPN